MTYSNSSYGSSDDTTSSSDSSNSQSSSSYNLSDTIGTNGSDFFENKRVKYAPIVRTEDQHNRFYISTTVNDVYENVASIPRSNEYGLAYNAEEADDLDDLLEEIPPELIEKYEHIKECTGQDRIQLKEGKKEYHIEELNQDEQGELLPQFENCPDEEPFAYSSGWQWEDARTGSYTGAVPGGVLAWRASDIGPPLKKGTTETHAPGRVMNLPNNAVTMIHTEPVTIIWVHPYLERGEAGTKEGDKDAGPERNELNLGFSLYDSKWTWQSGPTSNSPTNSDSLMNAGMWSQAGGLNSNGNQDEAKMYYRRSFQGHESSCFRMGYSRGNDTILYGNSTTEGLEYGVVGMSGFVSALPNLSFGDEYNSGIMHAYTINRICTNGDELKANIQKFVAWLQDFIEFIQDNDGGDLLPDGFPGTGGGQGDSFSVSASRILDSVGIDPNIGEMSESDRKKVTDLSSMVGKWADYARERDSEENPTHTPYVSCADLIESGFVERMKQPWTPDAADEAILSLFFEFAGRTGPENAGVKESAMKFRVNPDQIFERAARGEPLTKLDVFRSFFTRCVLRDERLATQFGDFDIEKFGLASLGRIDRKEIRNERFFLYLISIDKDEIGDFEYENGVLVAKYKSGFIWNAEDFELDARGFIRAAERLNCHIYSQGSDIVVALPDKNGMIGPTIATFDDSFEEYFASSISNAFYGAEVSSNSTFAQSSNNEYGGDPQTNQRLLWNETTAGGKKRYSHKGDKIDHVKVDQAGKTPDGKPFPPDDKEYDYQRWTGGYCYPVSGGSAAARPDWDTLINTQEKGTAGNHSWDCSAGDAKENVWYVHTYGPFKEREMKRYYYFMIPLRRSEASGRMDYGIAWWWADDPKAPNKNWSMMGSGCKNPLDAYDPRMTPETPWETKAKSKYSTKCFYQMIPKKKYFRLSFYQWLIPKSEIQGGIFGGHAGSGTLKGPKVKSTLFPPMQCGKKNPGTEDGNHPHGVWFDFAVFVKQGDNPWEDQTPSSNELTGPVYWTDEEWKVAELANEHYQQPVNILEPFPNGSGIYRFTPVERIEHVDVEGETTPMMSVHMSPDGMEKGRDPVGNPGYRNRYGPHMTTIREMPVQLMINTSMVYSIAGWYPEEEHGGAHPPLEGGARRSVEQWSINGEPWIKIEPVSLEDGANGPGYWGNLSSSNSRPLFHNIYYQTPLHYFGQKFHTYHEPKDNQLPVVGRRMHIESLAKGRRYENPLTGEYEDWDTKEDYDVYFVMRDEALDIGYNRFEHLDVRVKFKYAFTLPKGGSGLKDQYVTCPTDKMIFAAVNTQSEFGPKLITEWNCDGERVNLRSKYHTGVRDHLKGCAYWTDSGSTLTTSTRVGVNGYVDFHDLYWKNLLTQYNDAVADGNDEIIAGQEYEITYEFGKDDVPTNQGGNANSRLRIIFGKIEESLNPAFQYDPGFEKTVPSSLSPKTIKDERLYTYTDIVLEPGKKTKFTADSDIMFFGVFNTGVTSPHVMGNKVNWSINGQSVNVVCKKVQKRPGCSLFVSAETVNPVPNNDRRTISQFDKYKLPYMHLTKEIAHYRNHTDPTIPGKAYDGGRLPLTAGRKYRLTTTPFTPIGHEYRLYFVDEERSLNKQQLTSSHVTEDSDTLPKLILKKVKGSTEESYIEFTALTPFVMLESWHSQLDEINPDPNFDYKRTYEDWNEEGEPAFLKLSYAEDGIIEGVQYWTDAPGNEGEKASQLKSLHWLSPMHPLKPLGVENPNNPGVKTYIETKPDTRYEIEVLDREDNPDYLHKIYLGPKPDAYRPGEFCQYKMAASLRKGQTKTFDTGLQNFIIMIGADDTKRQLTDWNRDGEPIFVKLKEVYKDPIVGPVYPGDHLDKDEFDWNEWTHIAVNKYGESQMFANPVLDIKTEDQIDDEIQLTEENKYFTKVHSAGEANTDKTPRPVTGRRYRISPQSAQNELVPEDYKADLPYALRVWNYRNDSDVNPLTFSPNKLKGNRVFFPQLKMDGTPYETYCDFVAEDSNVIFGAAGIKGRDIFTWSRKGEPTNVKIEALPVVPTSGPAYWASYATKDRPPMVEDKHFLKPLNIFRNFVSGNEYQAKAIVDQLNSTTRIWWVLDMTDPTIEEEYNRKSTNEARQLTNCPLKWDPAHPEDLVCEDFSSLSDAVEFQWQGVYQAGPILTQRAGYEYEYFKVPPKVVGAIFAVYKEPGQGGGASRAANDATDNITDWNMDGQPLQWGFEPREKDTRTGPVYWGNNTAVNGQVPHSFNDPHFTELNKISVVPGQEYLVEQKGDTDDWKDYTTVDLYAYSSRVVNEKDPKSNEKNYFTKVGTFTKDDTSITIEAATGMYSDDSLIASARSMTTTNRSLNNWSPNGEKEPFKLKKKPEVRGPVYWGDNINGTNPNHTWGDEKPNFGNDKWKEINFMLLEKGADYNLKVIANGVHIGHDYSLWISDEAAAVTPNKAKSNMWHRCEDLGTLKRANKDLVIGTEHNFQATGKYLCFGAINTTGDTGTEYSFENWSRKGEPSPFRIQKQPFPRGPAYPAMDKKGQPGNRWQCDLEHKRWNKDSITILPDPIVPRWNFGMGDAFRLGLTYKLKVKETTLGQYHYNFFWIKWASIDGENPSKIVSVWDKKINLPTTSWSSRASGSAAYVSFFSKTGQTQQQVLPKPQTASMSAWSPDGHPFKFKATIDWMELIPPNWWKWLFLLAALLAALIAVYAYLTLTAPVDVLLQMVEDHEETEYSIKRYKGIYDDEGREIGFGYPNEPGFPMWGYGPETLYPRKDYDDREESIPYNMQWTTQPKFFNWTADYMTRAWARIMKLRHNGYMFHMSRNYNRAKYDTIIKDSYTAEHALTLANMSQTFGIGYSKLTLDSANKYKKIFRYYTEYGDDGKGDFNVDRFNPYDYSGVKVLKVDTQTNPLKQRPEWHNDLQWFDADYSFMHFCRQDTIVESRGGARYKSAISLSDTYTKYLKPEGPAYGPKAMFTSLGWGVSTDHYFDTQTSSHAYVWEVLNCGDSSAIDDWPGVVSQIPGEEEGTIYSHYLPVIEFDMDIIDGNTQLNQVHVNYETYFFGEASEKMARKMAVDGGSYVMRDSFENSHSRDNFTQGSQKKLRLKATEPVDMYKWKLASISFCFWIGTGKGKKGMVVKNLKAESIMLKPSDI